MQKKGDLRIGISGWRYTPWRGTFYPKGLRQDDELAFASRQMNFDEINGTFYSLQRPSSFQDWYDATPADFLFSVKGPRFITHMRRLKAVAEPLANFWASGVLALADKLGPVLWQFPPNFKFDADLMANFFDLLPRTTQDASKQAKRNNDKVKGRVFIDGKTHQPLRHAVEIRHESFENKAFVALLRKHKIGLVIADTAGKWPFMEDVTADFVYIRLHGDEELYVSGYTDAALDSWAKKIDAWRTGKEPRDAKRIAEPMSKSPKQRDIFVAFDNDVKVRAPFDAIGLATRLDLPAGEARAKKFPLPEKTK
jgi:uncharacterized protein YecE (DUF72 family)